MSSSQSSSHDSKRILIHNYYTPKLPADSGLPSLTSNRVAGDYSIQGSYRQPSQQQQQSRSYPQVPDDIQARLLHVGMSIRKQVADGHRVPGSIPSYQPNFPFGSSFAEPSGATNSNDLGYAQKATRNLSAPATMASPSLTRVLQHNRPSLKRGRVDEEDEDAAGDTDTDDDDGSGPAGEPASFQDGTPISAYSTAAAGGNGSARRLGSTPGPRAKVFYVPAPTPAAAAAAAASSSVHEDFEEATFLASRESLQ